MYLTAIANHKTLIVFDTPEAREAFGRKDPMAIHMDLEIDVLDKIFARERMVALIAAARTFKKNGDKPKAMHYAQCAWEERKSFIEGKRK